MTTETLYDALWPDIPRSRNSSSLKVAAHMLRTVLAAQNEHAAKASSNENGAPPYLRLVTHELGYMLESHNVWVDFEIFEDLTNRARIAYMQGADETAMLLFRSAMDVYRGDFLPGESLGWAEVQRVWLRGRAVMSLEKMIQCCIQSGNYAAAVDYCYMLLKIEPLCEEIYRVLIAMHGHLGHLSQVRRWYTICIERLRTELQIEPDQTTQQVYQRAVRGEFIGSPLVEMPGLT
jgi:two-component SAPR family response regulator